MGYFSNLIIEICGMAEDGCSVEKIAETVNLDVDVVQEIISEYAAEYFEGE